jgi:hypothetical protein
MTLRDKPAPAFMIKSGIVAERKIFSADRSVARIPAPVRRDRKIAAAGAARVR